MQERRLRLGDILDDYCPRERRITNHAVVAMVDNEVKQTRCVACDAEHPYRAAQVPVRRRKKDTPAALYQAVLAGRERAGPVSAPAPPEPPRLPEPPSAAPGAVPAVETGPDAQAGPAEPAAASPARDDQQDEGPVHRPLIRATLPRADRQTPARPIPQFTIRQIAGKKNVAFRDAKRPGWPIDEDRPPAAPRFAPPQGRGPLDRAPGGSYPPRGGLTARSNKKRSR